MSQQTPELSVIVPAYNEAEVLSATLEALHKVLEPYCNDYEIIVVDDGSSDGSYALLANANLHDKRVKAIHFSRRFGKEAALHAGLSASRGAAVITIDADMQHPPQLIPEMLNTWREGARVVNGVKRQRAQPFGRKLISIAFNRAFSRLAGFDLRKSSDFKLLDQSIVQILIDRLPERGRFYRGLVTWIGGNQVSIEYDVNPRAAGTTAWSGFGLTRYALDAITAFSALPLRLLPIFGLLMLLVSFVLGTEAVVSKLNGQAISGFATLEMTLLFVGSLILIGMGIIGQYLVLLYDEVKRRPHYIIDRRLDDQFVNISDHSPRSDHR